MYSNTSNTFNINVRQASRTFVADIRDVNESLNTVIRSIKHTAGANSQNFITLGSAICASVEIKMTNPGVMMLGKEYGIYIGMNINGSQEYVPLGLFTAEKPVVDENGEVTVTLYDRMKKFEAAYFSHLTYPALLTDVLSEVCATANVPYNPVSSDIIIETKPEGYTCREMIVYIAQLLGCFAIIDREGELTFKWYSDIRYTIGADRYFSPFGKSENNYILTKITAVVGKETDESGSSVDKKIIAGTGAKGIMFENPFYTQSIMDGVYNSLNNMTFRPASLKAMGDPRLEPGDIITVLGLNNEEYKVPVMNIVFTYDGGLSMNISAVGEEEQKNDFSVKGPATQAVERMSTRLLLAEQALVTKLTADEAEITYAKIRDLNTTNASITQLRADFVDADNAIIRRLSAAEATITDLNVGYGKISTLESGFARIDNLLAGNAAATQAQMIHLNADNALIDTAWLKDLMAENITVNDLKAGTIYTNNYTVQNEAGTMVMDGSRLTFKDDHDVIRIQLGKDGQGNYNYYLANENGDIVWDAAGITANGVPNGLIVDDMVAGKDSTTGYNGISPSKLDIHSMVGALNEEGGLKSSSIVMDEDNQSLTVAFSNLKSNVDNMSFGGRNLIKNTLNPDVSAPEKYPRLIGQTYTNTMSAGSVKTVAEHGIRVTNTGAVRINIRFGSSSPSSGDLNGLVPGETYTLSFDASWQLLGGTIDNETTYYFRAYLYDDRLTNGTFKNHVNSTIASITPADRGEERSGRCEFTFTIPSNVTMLYLQIMANISTASYYAAGDYIEIRNLKLEKGTKASDWSPAPEDLQAEWKAADASINAILDDLQDQIDGVVDTYYYGYAPTLNNIPASDWATTDYPAHKGDMFLDTSTGKSYRFLQNETSQSWEWKEIPDTASAEALQAAQEAKDLADHKRRVFVGTATPAVPYDVGDLWFEGEGGDIKTCTNAKTAAQTSDSADWSKLHKYTDNSYAKNAYSSLEHTIDGIDTRVGTVENKQTQDGDRISANETAITQTSTAINKIISSSQIEDLDTETTMYSKLLAVKQTADSAQTAISGMYTNSDIDGKITELSSVQTTFSQSLGGFREELSTLETSIQTDYSTTTETQALIDTSKNQILQSVSSTYAAKIDTVSAVMIEYNVHNSPTTAPAEDDPDWSSASPTWTQGSYIWQRTAITKNGTTTYSNVSCIQGAVGSTGVGIRQVIPRYCLWTSNSTAPANDYTGWSENSKPDWEQNKYLWTQTKVIYDDDTPTNPHVEYTTAICDTALNSLESRMHIAELKILDDSIVSTVKSLVGIGDENLIYNSTGYGGSTDGWETGAAAYWNIKIIADCDSSRPGKSGYALGLMNAHANVNSVMYQDADHQISSISGQKYTLSGYYYRGLEVEEYSFIGIEYSTDGGSSWTLSNDSKISLTEIEAWTFFQKTFIAPSDIIRVCVRNLVATSSESPDNVIYVEDLVLVKGEKAMPWAESSLSISESVVKQTAKEIYAYADSIRLQAKTLAWTADFSSLTESGELTIKKATIGNITVSENAIYSNGKTTYGSSVAGFHLNSNGKIGIGDRTNYLVWNGTDLAINISKLSWTSDNSSMTEAGILTAKGANITGVINATSGTIGGWNANSYLLWKQSTETSSGNVYQVYLQSAATSAGDDATASTNAMVVRQRYTTGGWKNMYELKYNGSLTSYGYALSGSVLQNTLLTNLTNGGLEIRIGTAWNSSGAMSSYNYLRLNGNGLTTNHYFSLGGDGARFTYSAGAVKSSSGISMESGNRYLGVGGGYVSMKTTYRSSGTAVISNCNDYLTDGSGQDGDLFYSSSSSKRYKDYIGEETESDALKLLDLPVVRFKYKEGYLDNDDENYDRVMVGLFAEDVAEQFEDAVYHKGGYVENYTDRQLLVRLIKLVQIQHREIEQLKQSAS